MAGAAADDVAEVYGSVLAGGRGRSLLVAAHGLLHVSGSGFDDASFSGARVAAVNAAAEVVCGLT